VNGRVVESVIESANTLLVVGHLSLSESFDDTIELEFSVDIDGLGLGIGRRSNSVL